jgi:hypothetical protein
MDLITIVDTVVLVGLWVWALWGPLVRGWRTVSLLGITTAVYLLGGQLPLAAGVPLRVLAVGVCISLLLFHEEWFVAMKPAYRRFDTGYSRVLGELRILSLSWNACRHQIPLGRASKGARSRSSLGFRISTGKPWMALCQLR